MEHLSYARYSAYPPAIHEMSDQMNIEQSQNFKVEQVLLTTCQPRLTAPKSYPQKPPGYPQSYPKDNGS